MRRDTASSLQLTQKNNMAKKGKRPPAHAADDSRRRKPAVPTGLSGAASGAGSKTETIMSCKVVVPPVLPPDSARSGGGKKHKRIELELTSHRVYHETILSINNLLSDRECRSWIRFGEEQGFQRTFHKQSSEIAHRDNGRITLHSPDVAAAVFARVGPFVPTEMEGRTSVGCNANIRVYRYGVGQRFGKHVDESVEDENGHLSQWTVLVYLNGGSVEGDRLLEADGGRAEEEQPLRGGETVFYKGNYGGKVAASFSPLKGACLVHGHGRQCLLHEGAAVSGGVKYLLRTDVMYA